FTTPVTPAFDLCLIFVPFIVLFSLLRPPPRSTLFPYTTALPISGTRGSVRDRSNPWPLVLFEVGIVYPIPNDEFELVFNRCHVRDRKSTRLNSSHGSISYAVFCLKKKNKTRTHSRKADHIT